jgi:hypothetical protein
MCDFHYPQDAYVAILYLGRNVGVRIIWAINDGYWRAIKLESLIDMICPEKNILPLPQITPKIGFSETERRINKNIEMIRADMSGMLGQCQ